MFDTLTIEELEAANRELMTQKEQIREQQRALNEALTRKQAEIEAARKLAAMSDAERAALTQMLKAESITPAGAVGVPGAG